MKKLIFLVLVFALVAAAEFQTKEWEIEGLKREALIWIPQNTNTAVPVVFAFHGHGGTMANAARSFRMHEVWPEAVCVYMQGLPTPGKLSDPEGKRPGWQQRTGIHNDRDLKFFDAVFESLKQKFPVDESRIYCTGHSNGGAFTYLLWGERGELFAAVAPSGSLNRDVVRKIKSKPVIHVAGKTDPLVKYEWQEAMLNEVRRVNQCSDDSAPWESAGGLTGAIYPSAYETPLVTLIHPGGHEFPKAAPELIAKFFKQFHK